MPQTKYKYVIFDADHTLIDFYADERAAFRRTFSFFGANYTEEDIERARVASDSAWAEAGLNDVHLESVRATFHTAYFAHIPGLFARIREFLPVNATNEALAEKFLRELNAPSLPLGNALQVLKTVAEKYPVCIATNGMREMQEGRLREFLPYVRKLFVSQDFGTIKPDVVFFEKMLSVLHAKPQECLFVGDSLSSDVRGCIAVGMPCVWFDPDGRELPGDCRGHNVRVVTKLEELSEFL